jgi:tetratricopeptide (TPR) repeat protein
MREAALATANNSELSLSRLAALNDHGVVLARLGRLEEAEENFERASERVGGREKPALALAVKRNQGLMAWIGEDPTAGLDLWADAFRAGRTADDAGGNAQTLNNVGVLRLLEGEGDEALQLFNRAILLAQRGGDLRSLVFAYNNLGLTFSGPPRGDHIAAIPFAEMALALLTGPLDILVRLYVLNNNIIVYEQAHLEPARKFRAQFAESLKAFTSTYPHRRADLERAKFASSSGLRDPDLSRDDEWEISAAPVLLRAGARCGVQT